LYRSVFDDRDADVDVVRMQDLSCLIEELPPIELIALTMTLVQQLTKGHAEREEAKLQIYQAFSPGNVLREHGIHLRSTMDVETSPNELGGHPKQVGDVGGCFERVPRLCGDTANGGEIGDAKWPNNIRNQIVSLIRLDSSQNKSVLGDIVRQNGIQNCGVSTDEDDYATLYIGGIRGQFESKLNPLS
jgi:hypothetical protein